MDDNIFKESEVAVPRHARVSVLFVTEVVRARLVVRCIDLVDSGGDQCVVDSAVVSEIISQRIKPWRGDGRGRQGEFVFPWFAVWVYRVLFASHVELGRVPTVFVVGRIDLRWLRVDCAVGWVAVARSVPQALAKHFATIVVLIFWRSNVRRRECAVDRRCAIRRVVRLNDTRAWIFVCAVESLVFANESHLISRFDESSSYVDVIPLIVLNVDFVRILVVQCYEDGRGRLGRWTWRRG